MLILREILLGTISSLFTWRNGEQKGKENLCQFVVVQVLSHAWLFATPGTTACQASVPFTVSWSLLMSIDLVMPSNHLILCHPLLLQGKAFFVLCCAMLSCSVMSDSFCPCGLYPTRLLCPWDFPGKNPGVGCHFILQGSSCICLLFFPSSKIRKIIHFPSVQFSSVQLLSPVRLFVNPWIAALQASLSITNSWSLLKPMSIVLVMPSNHLIFCCPLLLPPSIFPSIRVFSNELALHLRWPKYQRFSISPFNEYLGLILLTGLISFQSKGLSRVFLSIT